MHQFGPFRNEFSAVPKLSQVHPNITKHTETCVLGPIVWIGLIRGDKFKRDFVARTYALIYCSNKMVPNAPKPYDMEQNMSLGSHGVFLLRS